MICFRGRKITGKRNWSKKPMWVWESCIGFTDLTEVLKIWFLLVYQDLSFKISVRNRMLPFVDKTILVRLRTLCFSDIIEKNIWKERERWNGNRIRNILTISIWEMLLVRRQEGEEKAIMKNLRLKSIYKRSWQPDQGTVLETFGQLSEIWSDSAVEKEYIQMMTIGILIL